mgnify:CR=1 FL=1
MICIARTSGKTDSGVQNWPRSNWAHSPCKSLCWCLYLGRKCVSFQLKYRYYPTPIVPTCTCLLRNSHGNRQFFRTFFLGGISCDSSSLTRRTYNVVMRAYFKIGALYSGRPGFKVISILFLQSSPEVVLLFADFTAATNFQLYSHS